MNGRVRFISTCLTYVESVLGDVLGLHNGPATLTMTCRACDVLVSSVLQSYFHMIECLY